MEKWMHGCAKIKRPSLWSWKASLGAQTRSKNNFLPLFSCLFDDDDGTNSITFALKFQSPFFQFWYSFYFYCQKGKKRMQFPKRICFVSLFSRLKAHTSKFFLILLLILDYRFQAHVLERKLCQKDSHFLMEDAWWWYLRAIILATCLIHWRLHAPKNHMVHLFAF